MAAELLGFSHVSVVNLFALPSHATGEIAALGVEEAGWLKARGDLGPGISAADGVLLAYGATAPTGPARGHFRDQVEWVRERIAAEDLPVLMKFLHAHGVKGYVAFNTLVFTSELEDAETQLRVAEAAGVDAVIVQDLGLARMVKLLTPRLRLHASTQMTITSPEGLEFAKLLSIDQAVLSRELSLRELERFEAAAHPELPLEVFVHGALCVAYSGQCLTSESLGRRSANRGECAQACRMPYDIIVDGEQRDLGDKRYLLSPQDLAAVNEIPRLIELGIRIP